MGTVELDRVSFAYAEETPVLHQVSFRLPVGVTALIGSNGAGKTTLLRLITGELSPDAGLVRRLPSVLQIEHTDGRLEQESDSVRAFLRSARPEAHRLRVQFGLLAHLQTAWQALSPGLRRRLQLAAALHRQPDLWLLDEPSNHIDAEARALLMSSIRQHRGSTLLISHDRALIDALAVQTLHLERGVLHSYEGGYSAAQAAIERARSALLFEKQQRESTSKREQRRLDEARRQQAATERARSARSRSKGPRNHDARSFGRKIVAGWAEARAGRTVEVQRRTAERAASRARELFVEKRLGGRLFAQFTPCSRPQVLALQVDYLGYGERAVLSDVRLALGRSARVRLDGPNGAGKTTLLSALYAAARDPARVLYVPQEITPSMAAARLGELHALEREPKGRVLEILAALGVEPEVLLKTPNPSAGEARKLWLALGLGRGAHALLLDEPTNDLDLPSVERLEAALSDYPGALLVVTHDPQFAAATLAERWVLEDGHVRFC